MVHIPLVAVVSLQLLLVHLGHGCADTIHFRDGKVDSDPDVSVEVVPAHFSISEMKLHPIPVVSTPAVEEDTSNDIRVDGGDYENESESERENEVTQTHELIPLSSMPPTSYYAASSVKSVRDESSFLIATLPPTPSVLRNDQCDFEISCKHQSNLSMTNRKNANLTPKLGLIMSTLRLPVQAPPGPRGPPGDVGDKGDKGVTGAPGIDGISERPKSKIAFFVGLIDNLPPTNKAEDVKFGAVVTNVGNAYHVSNGRFIAPVAGTYMFHVSIAAQGNQKAAVRLLFRSREVNETKVIFTLWCESIPYWSSTSNSAVLQLRAHEQVWVRALATASAVHGYMYSTFSGHIIFNN